jgi:colanic acid/amylovoran biosynthesis glycosyltransferase
MAGLIETEPVTRTFEQEQSPPRVRSAIAVVVTYFPRIDETPILREINELEANGQPVTIVPIVREFPSVVHEEAKPWIERALFTPFLSWAILLSNLRFFGRHPLRYLRLLATLIGGTIWRPSTLIRTLSIVPKGVHLGSLLTDMGIRHVHAHFATHAATMAYIISAASDLTFSFSVYGPDIFVHRLMLSEKLSKAKFVRCVSTFNKAFLLGLYPHLSEHQVHVVRTGVNVELFESAARRAGARKSPRPQLLTVAALTPQNGFGFLIDACARLLRDGIDLDCRIVGDGPLRAATEQWIAHHGLTERVRIVGNLPQHEVARLMGEADIFVLPSIIAANGQMDGLPISLMEAMAAGKAVVASGLSGIPELVRHEVNGLLVDAAYPQRIATAIQRLIEDPVLRERLGAEGQRHVREKFDVRRTARSMITLLDEVSDVNRPEPTTVDRILHLNWSRINVTALGVRRVRETPQAYVAEVAIHDGVRKRDVIVRQHRESFDDDAAGRARAEFEALTTLAQSLDAAPSRADDLTLSTPRLIMFDEPHSAIATERSDGKSLAGILSEGKRTSASRLTPALRHTGMWLRRMQDVTKQHEDGRHVLTAIVVLAIRDVELVAAAEPVLALVHGRLVDRLQRLEATLAEQPLPGCGHHGSFRPENVFLRSRGVEVANFGNYREGLALEDVAEMLLQLEIEARKTQLPALRKAFLQGYGDEHPDPIALQLFEMTRALRMLAHDAVSRHARRALRAILIRSLA